MSLAPQDDIDESPISVIRPKDRAATRTGGPVLPQSFPDAPEADAPVLPDSVAEGSNTSTSRSVLVRPEAVR